MELTKQLSQFCVDFSLKEIPKHIIEHFELTLLDCVGVTLAGSVQPVGDLIRKYTIKESKNGASSVIGDGECLTSPSSAAMANATMAHALDFDDRGHSSAHLLWTATAIAEQETKTHSKENIGIKILEASLLGREIRLRFDGVLDKDRAKGKGPGSRGWHATGTHGVIASAITAAKLLHLNVDQTQNTIGISASLASSLIGNFGTMTKPLHSGMASKNGIMAAELSLIGFSANKNIIEEEYGFINAFCLPNEADAELLVSDLGLTYYLEKEPFKIKPYPIASTTQRAADAAKLIRQKFKNKEIPYLIENITSIECPIKPYPLFNPWPSTGLEGKFSVPYVVAVMLITGNLTIEDFHETAIFRKDIRKIMNVIAVTNDNVLRVKFKNGTILEEHLSKPRNLNSLDEVFDKFDSNCEKAGKGVYSDTIREAILNIHDLETPDFINLMSILRINNSRVRG